MSLPPRLPVGPRRLGSYQARLLAIATALVLVGFGAFLLDVPVARWCSAHRLPGELGRLINLLEISGHALGAAVILGAAVTLDRSLRIPLSGTWQAGERAFARMAAATYLGGLLVDVIKVSVARVRPRAADLAGVASWLGTFGEESLAARAPHAVDLMSFPSGHSAVAAGLAAALTWRYPHGAILFAGLAAATAIQRIVTSAHYPSDTAFGAAFGLIAAACCLGGRSPGRIVVTDSRP